MAVDEDAEEGDEADDVDELVTVLEREETVELGAEVVVEDTEVVVELPC